MVADVVRMMNTGYREEANSSNSEILITKDFLGGLSSVSNTESNLDLQREKLYHTRCKSPNSPLSSEKTNTDNNNSEFQDLNYEPTTTKTNLFLEESSCLDLKLESSSNVYESVCTLDKVKSALQRAEKNQNRSINVKKRSIGSNCSMFAAGCPGCLLYVITLKTNPKCPRCNSIVPSPSTSSLAVKKAKIDLN